MTRTYTLVIGIDHVQSAAPPGSEPALRRFYVEVLGFREVEKPKPVRHRGGVWFDCGNMQLHIGIDKDGPVNLPSRRHVAFVVHNLEQTRRIIEEAGLPIEEDKAPIEGVARFYSRDPAENRVEFLVRH